MEARKHKQESRKLTEGLSDIQQVVRQCQEEQDEGGEVESSEKDPVQDIISCIFSMRRNNESVVGELQHKLDMQKLQSEDVDTIKFDNEILTQEKSILEA